MGQQSMQIHCRNLKKKTSTHNNLWFIQSVRQPKFPDAQRNCAQWWTHRILTSWSLPLYLKTIIRFLLSISAAIFSITKSFVLAYIDMCRHPDTRDHGLLRKILYPCYCGRFTSTAAYRCATALMYINMQWNNNI